MSKPSRNLTLGYSPCPNDTFNFGALAKGHVSIPGIRFNHGLHDVETLNRMAMAPAPAARLDVSKLSFYAWLMVRDRYQLLDSGAALGEVGPLLISKRPVERRDLSSLRIVAPGQWTTARLLLKLWAPDSAEPRFTTYDRIFDELNADRADLGLIIHESRFTYEGAGFVRIMDLGEWWRRETGLPIPLGCIAAKRELGEEQTSRIARGIRQSLAIARQDPSLVDSYIRSHAQELDADTLAAHIRAFVNEYSLSLGETGRQAVKELEQRARDAGAIV